MKPHVIGRAEFTDKQRINSELMPPRVRQNETIISDYFRTKKGRAEVRNSDTPYRDGYPMKACGARTRSGGHCRTAAMPNGRCRMHGGKSLRHWRSPRWRHGRFSKYSQAAKDEAEARRERKASRVERAVTGKLAAWWADRPKASVIAFLGASRRIRREHLASLERRREAYRARKLHGSC